MREFIFKYVSPGLQKMKKEKVKVIIGVSFGKMFMNVERK